MEVMRNNQEALLTILEVLLYDPLYAWTISPAKAYALQQRRDKNDQDTLDVTNTTTDLMDLAEASNRSNNNSNILYSPYSKTCVKRPLSKRPKISFQENYRLMQVKSIALHMHYATILS